MNTIPYELNVSILKLINPIRRHDFYRISKLMKIIKLFFKNIIEKEKSLWPDTIYKYDNTMIGIRMESTEINNKDILTFSRPLIYLDFDIFFLFKQIDYLLPKSLKYLRFGTQFHQSVDNLPPNIIRLIFRFHFNQNVDKLPKKLKYLEFGHFFNQTVNHLPKTITHLNLGIVFNQDIPNLPPNLTHLILSRQFDKSVDTLPVTLIYLKFGMFFRQKINRYPPKLICLIFGCCFNNNVDNLPQSLIYLKFDTHFNKPISNLPTNLSYLILGPVFKQSIDNLPIHLTHLKLHSIRKIPKLPPNLIKLTIVRVDHFNADSLPKKLQYLDIDLITTNKINGNFPLTLSHLKLGSGFNKKIIRWCAIKYFYISKNYKYINSVPKNINVIFLKN